MEKGKKLTGIIYKYTSPTGKCYIGQTIHEAERKKKHKTSSNYLKTKFSNAVNKYGFENFEYEVLFKINSDYSNRLKIILDLMEIKYIKLFNSITNGYNQTLGGGGILGFKHSDESKLKIGMASKGNKHRLGHVNSEEHQNKIISSNLGRKNSDETKLKMSNSHKCKIISEESKRKMSESHKGKNFITEEGIKKLKEFKSKRVIQYDLDLNKIKEYASITEAGIDLNIHNSGISKCCNGLLKKTHGFIFKFVN